MRYSLAWLDAHEDGWRARRCVGHFLTERSGAAMVEFAMTGAMFLLSILWLLEVGLTYLATLELESATREVARLVRTNRQNEVTGLAVPKATKDADRLATQFRSRVCVRLVFSADCENDVKVFVRSAPTFAALGALPKPPADPFTSTATAITSASTTSEEPPWERDNFVIVTAFWRSPLSVFTDSRIIQAAAVTRNEP